MQGNGVEHFLKNQTPTDEWKTHRSAKEESPYLDEIYSLEDAKRVFIDWIEYHNTDCAYQALGYDIPINVYIAGSLVYNELVALNE